VITIRKDGNTFTVTGDNVGRELLKRPLHRLFLRGTLDGAVDEARDFWRIPLAADALETLGLLVDHLTKYSIPFAIDEDCRAIFGLAAKKRAIFQELRKTGLVAKKQSTKVAKTIVRRQLSTGFKRALTDLQYVAVNHLMTVKNGANFSVPGSGKTAVVLAYFDCLKARKLADAIFVIGPFSCFEPWEAEYELCFGTKAKSIRFAGLRKSTRLELYLTANRYDVLLTTYHSAARDVPELTRMLQRRKYLVVLDESHYVKRPYGGKLAEAVLGLGRFATLRVILTGTPMPNGLADLWSQFTFLWCDQLPLGKADEYTRDIEHGDPVTALSIVRNRIDPLFFRITKKQLNLPRPTFKIMQCDPSALQSRIYRGVATRFLAHLSEAPRDKDALREWRRARTIRLLQIASNPGLLRRRSPEFQLPAMDAKGLELREAIEHYAKYEMPNKIVLACNLANELSSIGKKVILWSTFVHNLQVLAHHLEPLKPAIIHGQIPVSDTDDQAVTREKELRRFREDSRCMVLIANPAACAESISLHHVCHDAVYIDRSFNCAHYLQSLDRIHRLGLPKTIQTTYYLLMTNDSIDEVIHRRLIDKLKAMRDVVEGDMPGVVPGYWLEDLGDEETVDWGSVEAHIKKIVSASEDRAR
jgi:SNF2 family DNA or RNA helicase